MQHEFIACNKIRICVEMKTITTWSGVLPWLHYHIKFDIHTSCWFCTETILAQVRILCLWKKTQILHSLWELLKENQFYARKYSFLRMMNPEGYHMYNYWCLYLFIIDCLKRKGIQCLKLDNNIQLYLW